MMDEKRRFLLLALCGVLCISFSAIFVRLADAEPLRSAFLRVAYAVPLYLLINRLLVGRRADDRSAPKIRLLFVGVVLGIDLILLHEAIRILGAGLAVVIANVQVLFVGIASVTVFHERLAFPFWAALPIALGGLWLVAVSGEPLASTDSYMDGLLIGLASALLYATYIVGLRFVRLRGSGNMATGRLMAWVSTGATLAIGVPAAAAGVAAPAGAWNTDAWLLALALVGQVAGWYLVAASIHRLEAATTGLLLLLNPALAVLWSSVFLREQFSASQATGMGVILVAILLAHLGIANRWNARQGSAQE